VYHGFIGVAALPAGLATGWIWDRMGARWALGLNAACAAAAAAALAWLAFAGSLRRSLITEPPAPVRSRARD
jgi:hypothetical protein